MVTLTNGAVDTRTLQQQALERARSTFGSLVAEDAIFSQANSHKDAVAGIFKALKLKHESHRKKRRTIVERFEKYTQ